MRNDVVHLVSDNKRPARLCVDCALFREKHRGLSMQCIETNNYASLERKKGFASIHRCGPDGKLWTKKQPKPPSFLKRLGDAIIDRISRKQQQ